MSAAWEICGRLRPAGTKGERCGKPESDQGDLCRVEIFEETNYEGKTETLSK